MKVCYGITASAYVKGSAAETNILTRNNAVLFRCGLVVSQGHTESLMADSIAYPYSATHTVTSLGATLIRMTICELRVVLLESR